MMDSLALKYGLHRSVKLEQLAENHIGIVKRVKSRIIQKDALKIVVIANVIRRQNSSMQVSLLCNANICSKSLALLSENGIEVIFE